MKPPIFNSMPADLDHFGMFELSFNLDPLKKSKFVHEILTLRRLMVENIPSPRIGLVWGNPEILGHTWSLRPNILFCIVSETLNRFCFKHPFCFGHPSLQHNSISSKKKHHGIFFANDDFAVNFWNFCGQTSCGKARGARQHHRTQWRLWNASAGTWGRSWKATRGCCCVGDKLGWLMLVFCFFLAVKNGKGWVGCKYPDTQCMAYLPTWNNENHRKLTN